VGRVLTACIERKMCLECGVWLLYDPVVGHNTRFDTRIDLGTSTRDMVQGWRREVD
jgi:hypothetical protein